MWPFRNHAPQPPADWAGASSFDDWTEEEIAAMSAAMRSAGQPDSEGWRKSAVAALNALRSGAAVELVARALERHHNPGSDPDEPLSAGTHYMNGLPKWCSWVESARPAVQHAAGRTSARSGYYIDLPPGFEDLEGKTRRRILIAILCVLCLAAGGLLYLGISWVLGALLLGGIGVAIFGFAAVARSYNAHEAAVIGQVVILPGAVIAAIGLIGLIVRAIVT